MTSTSGTRRRCRMRSAIWTRMASRRYGAALRKARKASPVVEKEVETLKGLIDAADVDVERAAELWAVIDAGVGEWIRTEIQKFRLAGIGADQESFI